MDVRRKLVAKTKRKLAKTSKVEERFRVSLSKGNYYEAHQTLRVLYERYVSLGRNDEAWILLQKGTVQLLTHDQVQWTILMGKTDGREYCLFSALEIDTRKYSLIRLHETSQEI